MNSARRRPAGWVVSRHRARLLVAYGDAAGKITMRSRPRELPTLPSSTQGSRTGGEAVPGPEPLSENLVGYDEVLAR